MRYGPKRPPHTGLRSPAGCRFLLATVLTLILHLALVEAHRWIRPQAGRIVKQLTLDSPGAASAHKRWRLEENSAICQLPLTVHIQQWRRTSMWAKFAFGNVIVG